MDRGHINEYIEAARSAEGFRAYLEKYVYDKTEADYQSLVGIPAQEVAVVA
jgi:hypothetical protein